MKFAVGDDRGSRYGMFLELICVSLAWKGAKPLFMHRRLSKHVVERQGRSEVPRFDVWQNAASISYRTI
jgi:hypothetical protein